MNNTYHKKIYIKIFLFIFIFFIIIELKNPLYRHYITRKYYYIAKKIANKKNKKIMVIGDPCCGNINMILQKIYPNCFHGDITIDLFGCNKCDKININDIKKWNKYKTNEYVIIESGTLSFSENIIEILQQIKRISGGDFFSGGSTINYYWKYIGNYLYSKKYPTPIKYIIYPYDFRKNNMYKVYNIKTKELKYIFL
jgi:hypothetical protein